MTRGYECKRKAIPKINHRRRSRSEMDLRSDIPPSKTEALKWVRTVYRRSVLTWLTMCALTMCICVVFDTAPPLRCGSRVAGCAGSPTLYAIKNAVTNTTSKLATTEAALLLPLVSTTHLVLWLVFPASLVAFILLLGYACILYTSDKVILHHALWISADGEPSLRVQTI